VSNDRTVSGTFVKPTSVTCMFHGCCCRSQLHLYNFHILNACREWVRVPMQCHGTGTNLHHNAILRWRYLADRASCLHVPPAGPNSLHETKAPVRGSICLFGCMNLRSMYYKPSLDYLRRLLVIQLTFISPCHLHSSRYRTIHTRTKDR